MKYTTKQKQALQKLKDKAKKFYLFAGGSRSGKSYLIARYIIVRAIKSPKSRHLIARYRFNHAKNSIWRITLLPLLKEILPKGSYTVDKTDYIITLLNGSEIWLGGLDDGDRVEKIMGTEYGTIFINEATQVSYDTYQSLRTRLNAPDITERFILDCNPRAPSHWLHRIFVEHKNPETMDKLALSELYDYMHFIPEDNQENLSDGYIAESLATMTGVKYKRYRHGIWCNSGEGTVYKFDRSVNHVDMPIEHNPVLETWASWDFGISDPTSIIVYQIMQIDKTAYNRKGVIINIIEEYENTNKQLSHYAEWIKSRPYTINRHAGDPAGTARSHDLKSWIHELSAHGIRVEYKSYYTSKVDTLIHHANDFMPGVRICETQCPKTVAMFENWGFEKNSDDKVKDNAKPKHDDYSHLGTSFYFFCINRWTPNQASIRKF